MNSTEGKTDGAPVHPVPAGDCLILVVDDESAICRMLDRCLRLEGFQVLTVSGGNEAIEMFQKERTRIALVLTDLVMPGMDGFALIERIRRDSSGVKIIAPAVPRLPNWTLRGETHCQMLGACFAGSHSSSRCSC